MDMHICKLKSLMIRNSSLVALALALALGGKLAGTQAGRGKGEGSGRRRSGARRERRAVETELPAIFTLTVDPVHVLKPERLQEAGEGFGCPFAMLESPRTTTQSRL